MADRIQARAIRRAGELLEQIEPAKNQHDANARDGTVPSSRTQAATDAGMSERQRKTALRVASVPAPEFDRQVESEDPPTVTALAEQGKRRLVDLGDSTPDDFKLATAALGALRRFAEFADATDPERAAKGLGAAEIQRARHLVGGVGASTGRSIWTEGEPMPVSTKPCLNPDCGDPGAEYVRDVEKRVGRDEAARILVTSWIYRCPTCGRESAYPAVRDGGEE